MIVQCDVCAAEAASVFCCADEAALCDPCDRRVHRANKLAGKHRRFSLLNPSPSTQHPPVCDICQERRGFLFCKEDRAILCRECDVPLHASSELTMRHSRFLLTGVRLSSAPAPSPAPPEEENSSSSSSLCCSGAGTAQPASAGSESDGRSSGSSISEYLTKTLPGWHVEDFLMDDAAATVAATATANVPADGLNQAELIGRPREAYPTWTAQEELFYDGAVGADVQTSREQWVPQMYAELAGYKRCRTSPCYPYW